MHKADHSSFYIVARKDVSRDMTGPDLYATHVILKAVPKRD